jgi:magnesium-transporting ATPase (P-type)
MLTGDKIETAKCIAIATGMNRRNEKIHEIRGEDSMLGNLDLKESILQYEKTNRQSTMLMIDGTALSRVMAKDEIR